ncbi:MAG: hypothetical protein OXI83_00220, partial [Gemmatimonadota bacterium]|nr:hypothetical protein [Gemmatimonadota bacterium]
MICTRIRWPGRKAWLVGGRSNSSLQIRWPSAVAPTGSIPRVPNALAYEYQTGYALPSGCTSTSRTMNSVPGADDATYSV